MLVPQSLSVQHFFKILFKVLRIDSEMGAAGKE